jgi:hypothetical protein
VNPTATQREIAAADKVRDEVAEKALQNAQFHERTLREGGSDIDRRYHAGAIDAYVAILRVAIGGHIDWLQIIRTSA